MVFRRRGRARLGIGLRAGGARRRDGETVTSRRGSGPRRPTWRRTRPVACARMPGPSAAELAGELAAALGGQFGGTVAGSFPVRWDSQRTVVLLAAAAAHSAADLDFDLDRVRHDRRRARRAGAGLLVLPGRHLGGYLNDLREPDIHARSGPVERGRVGLGLVGRGLFGRGCFGFGVGWFGFGAGGWLPPALAADDPVFDRLAELAGDLVLCLG